MPAGIQRKFNRQANVLAHPLDDLLHPRKRIRLGLSLFDPAQDHGNAAALEMRQNLFGRR
jgi:hypothetical protein